MLSKYEIAAKQSSLERHEKVEPSQQPLLVARKVIGLNFVVSNKKRVSVHIWRFRILPSFRLKLPR